MDFSNLRCELQIVTILATMQITANWRADAAELCVAALGWLAARGRTETGAGTRPRHLLVGERGEDAAFFFLRRQGFTVVAQRWNDGPFPGDIDLIAWQGDVLCFVEVKTRTSKDVATASSAVDRGKRKILRRLAGQYLRQLAEPDHSNARPETRFDIVTVYELPGKPREIQLIPAAFGWSESR
jgi:putative endonuclease